MSVIGTMSLNTPGSTPLTNNDVPASRHAASMGATSSAGADPGKISGVNTFDTTFLPARSVRQMSATASISRLTSVAK